MTLRRKLIEVALPLDAITGDRDVTGVSHNLESGMKLGAGHDFISPSVNVF